MNKKFQKKEFENRISLKIISSFLFFVQIDDVIQQRELRLAFSAPGMDCLNYLFPTITYLRDRMLRSLYDSSCSDGGEKKMTVLSTEQASLIKKRLVCCCIHIRRKGGGE
jgi:hypothetical protein